MQHAVRWGLGVALVFLISIPLCGCDLSKLHVIIPDFDSNRVAGVQVWRLDDGSQQPVAGGQLSFSEPYILQGHEVVDYTQVHADGSEGVTFFARVMRDPANPDTVSLDLGYERLEEAGWFKVSTFNSQGSSELSLNQTYL